MDAVEAVRLAPGPRGLPLIGNWLDILRKSPLQVLLERHRTYGDVVRSRAGLNENLLVNDPEGVRHVLQHNAQNYTKGPSYALLAMVMGKGLLTSEGPEWLRHRKLIQPAFHRQQMDRVAEVVSRRTAALAASWQQKPGEEIDVCAEMMRLTFQIVGEALFSDEVGSEAGEVAEAVARMLSLFDAFLGVSLLLPPGMLPRRLPLGASSAARLDRLVLDLVERRRRSGLVRDDLLGLLMAAQDEQGSGLTDQQLKDEVMTLILAGHETTANALSWAIALLARHPEVLAKLRAELDAVLGGRDPSGSDLPSLAYTERVLQETMRLYPPAWIVVRRAIGPDVVAGYRVQPGTAVQISPWTLHRHPGHWTEPERFDPDRFSPERSQGRSPWVYLPFGGGPRICIGKGFAMVEAKLVLATLVQRFDLALLPGQSLEPHPTVTLRPRDGVRVTVHPRAT